MGLFEKLFRRPARAQDTDTYFKLLNGYSPVFYNRSGGIYEMELTRAAIHSIANMCSKLKPEIMGNAYKNLEKTLQFQPNPYMDTSKFLYRLSTILSVDTTAFIIPLYAEDRESIVGFYPLLPQRVEIVEYKCEPWLRYTFANGQRAALEMSRVGILTRHQYNDEFFGGGNSPLLPTMSLLDIQRQGMEEGIRQSAMIRFMAKLTSTLRPEDIAKERERFSKDNLSADNKSGVMMFDAKYSDIKQIDSKPFVIDSDQMRLIQDNVFNYFGVNEAVLQNKYTEEEFNAFYESQIETFALQLGLVMTNMTFSKKEIAFGNEIMFSSNRLAYASNKTKLEVSQRLFDRGILSRDEIREIWQMKPLGDDRRFIRLEYADIEDIGKRPVDELPAWTKEIDGGEEVDHER